VMSGAACSDALQQKFQGRLPIAWLASKPAIVCQQCCQPWSERGSALFLKAGAQSPSITSPLRLSASAALRCVAALPWFSPVVHLKQGTHGRQGTGNWTRPHRTSLIAVSHHRRLSPQPPPKLRHAAGDSRTQPAAYVPSIPPPTT
jgi:hypothetical protein